LQQGASNPNAQRFHQISADLTSAEEVTRVMDEVVQWNLNTPPDIVWCCAGSSHPTLFVDTPLPVFKSQMNSNYFSSLYMAHAVLTSWLKAPRENNEAPTQAPGRGTPPARHVIFTASFLALYSFAGYSPYSPAKAALRSLSDTLSQEMNLYATAHPSEPRIRFHTIFPATILTEAYEAENRIKTDLTKLLEGSDEGQTPQVVAKKSIQALESGQELIATDLLTGLVKASVQGGSVRGGFWRGLLDTILASVLAIVMLFVRYDMDSKAKTWGREHGSSGFKGSDKRA
jgi:3-dehydrosphinganine reductase